ncbi:MAG: GNAT family N-acyltransferase [Planctomycetota bacterium]
MNPAIDAPFRLEVCPKTPLRAAAWKAGKPLLEQALRFPTFNALYVVAEQMRLSGDERPFAERALDAFGVSIRIDGDRLARIPKEGPLVVVANHPFGGIEGLILLALLQRVRPDAKLLANNLLRMVPDLQDAFFFVDPFGGAGCQKRNLSSMRSALGWVKDGHCLGVFPSGEVSHLTLRRRRVEDPLWNPTVGRIVQKTGAEVTPVFFDGRNSNAFQLAGLVQARLRTLMLPGELLRRRGRTVRVQIGEVIPRKRMTRLDEPKRLTDYLRVRTYLLRPTDEAPPAILPGDLEPTIDPVDGGLLEAEIDALPARQRLVDAGDHAVFRLHPHQGPNVLREVGRLREIAFRLVGEGTGRSSDLDRFDDHYQQLVLWKRDTREIVGGYRMARSDLVVHRKGVEGLYTHTLFDFDRRLIKQIGPALELGRAFVNPEHQKSFLPLLMLWQGIGTYAARHPRYHSVFGPVSISAEYSTMSRYLLWAFLKMHKFLPRTAKLLRARNPVRAVRPGGWNRRQFSSAVDNTEEVNALVRELETDGKPMPVLLRQYLKLDGKLLGFNVDPDFGNVVDGLIWIDLRIGDARILRKYLGVEGLARHRRWWGLPA